MSVDKFLIKAVACFEAPIAYTDIDAAIEVQRALGEVVAPLVSISSR